VRQRVKARKGADAPAVTKEDEGSHR
jgi:hypothetical protein